MIEKAERLQEVKEYYFSKKLREISDLKSAGKSIINIAIGNPDIPPAPEVIQAMNHTASIKNAHQYQSYQGIPALREAISNFYQKHYQVTINPANEILPLMGSKEGIMHISMAFLNKGDKVLVPNPGYPTYSSVSRLLQAEVINYNLTSQNNWFPDLEELSKQDLSRVKIMWVNYPHMPTGAIASENDFLRLISFCKKHQILLVNDNPYSFILNDRPSSILSITGAKEVCLELNSFSKTFNLPGWRVGMVLGKSEIIEAILAVKSNMDSGMFLGIQHGAIAAMNLGDDWLNNLNSTYRERRKLVWEIFDKLGCTYDKEAKGLFVWAKIPSNQEAIAYTDKLLYEKNIYIAPGEVFGTNGKEYVRASLCTPEEKLKEVLNRLN
jgi:aspartate/methionine/tyrosine aminotransferase